MSDRQALNRTTASVANAGVERVVQFGAGNFIRAFADWMIQELNEQTDFDAGVVVVKVTPNGTYEALDAQDNLFHVHTEGIQNGAFVSQTKLIHCISRTVYPYLHHQSYLDLARQADIRLLISNTTESGIQYHEQDALNDAPPSSFPAKLAQFLYTRYQFFEAATDKGCIILPTELVVDNGSQLREMVLRYAQQWRLESGFAQWIEQHNVFCNTLVDRIVPGYPQDRAASIQDTIGFEDRLLVMAEPYHSFVIAAPQPIRDELPFHKTQLNVTFTDDVDRYRQIKVRILNGLHTSMVPLGLLLGLETVRQCIKHPDLGQWLHHQTKQEIIPSMDLDQQELAQFAEDVFDRFRNPSIQHHLRSIAMNSSTKIRTRLVPTILQYQAKFGTVPDRVVMSFAAFIHLYKGEQPIPLQDDEAVLRWFAEQWQNSPDADTVALCVLQNTALWDRDLSQVPGLHSRLSVALAAIEQGQLITRIRQINGE